MKYYEIVQIRDEDYGIFDTVCYIGEWACMDVETILSYLGFESCGTPGSLMVTLMQKKDKFKYFGIDQYMVTKLNIFCKQMNLPVRVVRGDRRKLANGL